MKHLIKTLTVFFIWGYYSTGEEQTCRVPNAITLKREVLKEGFHRDLITIIEGNVTNSKSPLSFLLQENIPAGFYIDQYELTNLEKFGGPKTIVPANIDVEKPAHLSQNFSFLVFSGPVHTNENHFSVTLKIPIHLRYQRSQADRAHHMEVLPHPLLALRCDGLSLDAVDSGNYLTAPCSGNSELQQCYWKEAGYQISSPPPLMSVPVGQQSHAQVVFLGTVFVMSAFTLLLIKTMVKIGRAHV